MHKNPKVETVRMQDRNSTTDRENARRRLLGRKSIPLLILVIGLGIAYASGLLDLLSFEALRDHCQQLQDLVDRNPVLGVLSFILVYIVVVALSLPAGSLLTITGGLLFGTVAGTLYVVLAATIGATIVYLAARYAFHDYMHAKAGSAIRRMEQGFAENAMSYLMVLRLVPLFPFWLVNLVPALLGVKLRSFLIGTMVGIIPGTFVYASVGDGLDAVFDRGGMPNIGIIFEPRVLLPIIGLAVLALVPVMYKKICKNKAGNTPA